MQLIPFFTPSISDRSKVLAVFWTFLHHKETYFSFFCVEKKSPIIFHSGHDGHFLSIKGAELKVRLLNIQDAVNWVTIVR